MNCFALSSLDILPDKFDLFIECFNEGPSSILNPFGPLTRSVESGIKERAKSNLSGLGPGVTHQVRRKEAKLKEKKLLNVSPGVIFIKNESV